MKYSCKWIPMGLLFVVATHVAKARGQDDAAAFQRWMEADQAAFAAYDAEVSRQYAAFQEAERQAYDAFLAAAGAVWGRDNVWVPTETTWVQYTDDFDERSAADLETGEVRVSVILPDDADDATRDALLAEAVQRVALSGTTCPVAMMRRRPDSGASAPAPEPVREPYTVQSGDTLWGLARRFGVTRTELATANGIDPDGWLRIGQVLKIPDTVTATPTATGRARQPVEASARPILRDQVQTRDGAVVDAGNAAAFAAETLASRPITTDTTLGADGRTRPTATVTFALVPDHIRIRALQYRELVLEFAHRYQVYPPLIFAVMQTESSFNPRARSHAPAYGLMQLVPRSGARDAYRFVFKTDALVTGDYLYDPRNNVKLGVAYLHILETRYFRRIEHPTNRMLCAIAAYNTGAGNVSRAFGAGTSPSQAATIVNRMAPGEVYAQLRENLPHAETREYIRRVTDRMPQYTDWR